MSSLFIETSAKTSVGVRETFQEVVEKILDTPELWDNATNRPQNTSGGNGGVPGGVQIVGVDNQNPEGGCACWLLLALSTLFSPLDVLWYSSPLFFSHPGHSFYTSFASSFASSRHLASYLVLEAAFPFTTIPDHALYIHAGSTLCSHTYIIYSLNQSWCMFASSLYQITSNVMYCHFRLSNLRVKQSPPNFGDESERSSRLMSNFCD